MQFFGAISIAKARAAAIVSTAVLLLPLAAPGALAQQATGAEGAKADRSANAWVVNCSSGTTGTALTCQMSQNLSEKETGRRVLTVTIRKQADGSGLAMLLALPHGLFLPAGASYQIDGGQKNSVAIQTSDQNGAYAGVPLDDALIKALRSGTNLNIGMESVSRQAVTIPVSLTGFTAAIDKLSAVN